MSILSVHCARSQLAGAEGWSLPGKAARPDSRVPPRVPPWLGSEHQVGPRAPADEAQAASSGPDGQQVAGRQSGRWSRAFAGSDGVEAAWWGTPVGARSTPLFSLWN